MDICEKLVKFKFHILFAVAFSLMFFSLICLAPSVINALAFFWPLFVSTALFLAAVVLIGQTAPSAAAENGQRILDYIAAPNEPEVVQFAEESFESEQNM